MTALSRSSQTLDLEEIHWGVVQLLDRMALKIHHIFDELDALSRGCNVR